MLASGEICRVWIDGKATGSRLGKVVKVNTKSAQLLLTFDKGRNCKTITVPLEYIAKCKTSVQKSFCEPRNAEIAKTTASVEPSPPDYIKIFPTRYVPGETFGDFTKMVEDPHFSTGVVLFNDNLMQWEGQDTCAGLGNAAVRPKQASGDAIGVPTGPNFHSLDHLVLADHTTASPEVRKYVTIHSIQVRAFARIVLLFVERPDKDSLFYSIDPNSPPGSLTLGVNIFSPGSDVIDLITDMIHMSKSWIHTARQKNEQCMYTLCAMIEADVGMRRVPPLLNGPHLMSMEEFRQVIASVQLYNQWLDHNKEVPDFWKDVVTLSTWRKLVAIFDNDNTVHSLIQMAYDTHPISLFTTVYEKFEHAAARHQMFNQGPTSARPGGWSAGFDKTATLIGMAQAIALNKRHREGTLNAQFFL